MSYKLFLDDERMPEQVTWERYPFQNHKRHSSRCGDLGELNSLQINDLRSQ